jgi:predicted CoA-binding protein
VGHKRSNIMIPTKDAALDFLDQRRIAVAGVSRSSGGEHGGNIVYQRLRDRGYEVFAVNPNADEVEGDPCFPNVGAIPDGVDAVVIATKPSDTDQVMQDCVDAGITRAWMHRSMGAGSVSATATTLGRENGITVIDGGCPLMYGPASDFGHRVMGSVLRIAGTVPRKV